MSVLMKQPEVIVRSACELGEGPIWSESESRLYWVDIVKNTLWSWNETEGASNFSLNGPASGLALCNDRRLLAPVARGLVLIDYEEQSFEEYGASSITPPDTMMNDCKCDRMGRLIAGSKHLLEREPLGIALTVDRGAVKAVQGNFTVWNGPAFSPLGDRIYFADSPERKIITATYNLETAEIGKWEVFAELQANEGYPDGMTTDSLGRLWSARWDGWSVACYHPDGTLLETIELPVQRPTSLAFGGRNYTTLFITSARTRLSEDEIQNAPHSGDVFALPVSVAGLQEPLYQL